MYLKRLEESVLAPGDQTQFQSIALSSDHPQQAVLNELSDRLEESLKALQLLKAQRDELVEQLEAVKSEKEVDKYAL